MDTSLDGSWRARPDPGNIGLEQNWAANPWPEETVVNLPVPGLWQTSQPGLAGAVWYERTFTARPGWDEGHVEVKVGAGNYLTDAWLNGVHLGRHEGGYTPFVFALDEALRPGGENRIVLRVADVTDDVTEVEGLLARQIPGGKERWYYQASGIWQSVTLRVAGPAWIDSLRLIPDLDRSELVWHAVIGARGSVGETLLVEIYDEQNRRLASCRRELRLSRGSVRAGGLLALPGARAWSPQEPVLYTVRFRLAGSGDTREERVGFRDFALVDGRFRLNHREIVLKAVLLQPNYPATLLYPPDREWARRELFAAKEAGFNMIRLHLLPPVPFVLDLADEIGLLVYEESPAGWIKHGPRLAEHCRRETEEMIRRDWHHPSVVIWGLLNENVPVAEALGDELLSLAAGLDPTRIAIDNSGGTGAVDQYFAWAGRCRYFLPGQGITPAIDLHVYLNQVEQTAFAWLAGLGDPAQTGALERIGYGRPEDLTAIGASLASWAGGIFVSEYGFGGCEDLEASAASYPPASAGPDRAVAQGYAASLRRCLALPGVADAVGTVADFIAAAEEIHGRTDYDQTMAMRINPRLSGYGLTQLNDCAWEFAAGILDRWRRPKPSFAWVRAANDPLQILLWPGKYAFTLGEKADLHTWLVAEEDAEGEFRLELDGRPLAKKTVRGRGVLDLGSVTAALGEAGWHTAAAVFTTGDELRADRRNLLVLPPADLSRIRNVQDTLAGDDGSSALFWPAAGSDVDWASVLAKVRGGRTLILADLDPAAAQQIEASGMLPFHFELEPALGSWMPAWHVIPKRPAFAGLPAGVAGPLYAPVLPRYSWKNPAGESLAWAFRGTIHCGMYVGTTNYEFETYSDLAVVPHGDGKIVVCQFRLGCDDPVAKTILANLAGA